MSSYPKNIIGDHKKSKKNNELINMNTIRIGGCFKVGVDFVHVITISNVKYANYDEKRA